MHKLNLDFYPAMRAIIAKEMQSVMQWWCKMHLRHTSTYGVRVYHRGSMLINHVDRMLDSGLLLDHFLKKFSKGSSRDVAVRAPCDMRHLATALVGC